MFLIIGFAYIVFYLGPFYYSTKVLGLKLVNPITIVLIVNMPIDVFKLFFGPFFLLDGEGSKGLYFAYLMTILNMAVQLFLIILYLKSKTIRFFAMKICSGKRYILQANFKKLMFLFLFLAVVFFLILAVRSGTFLKWFFDPRDAYINNRVGNGIFYALSINFLSIASFFAFFQKVNLKIITFRFILFSFFLYPFGSKGLYINLFISFFIAVWRIDSRKLLKIISPAGVIMTLLVLYNFNSNLTSINFEQVSAYFDYFFNAAIYYDDFFSGIHELYFGKLYLSSFWEYVPRGIYPDKPYVYGILNIVEYYYPGGPASGNTPAFGGQVLEFADFGILGVIFNSIFSIGLLIKALFLLIAFRIGVFYQEKFSINELLVLIYLFAPSFGIYAPSFFLIILVIIVGNIINLQSKIKFKIT
jgi:hypothetical protein